MKSEGSVKQEHIIEAALKRFSHFGVNKTTLTEIADDLSISKPSLFYYFQDKNSLIAAVAGKIINEFLSDFTLAIAATATVEEALFTMVDLKRNYYKKYFLLAIQGDSVDMNKIPSGIVELYFNARKKSEMLLAGLLKKGVDEKVLKPLDTEKTSRLLLDTLSAFEYSIKKRTAIPELNDIDDLFDKQKQVVEMIVNGLKRNTCKN